MYKTYIKKTVMTLLSVILLFSIINVSALENNEINLWKQEAIIFPKVSQLVPAGPIQLRWKQLNDEQVQAYEIYFDGQLEGTVNKDITSYSVYSTQVSIHEVSIHAILRNNEKIVSQSQQFYISKKGIAYENIDAIQNLSASWYYNWGIHSQMDTDLEYVPMVWGSQNDESIKMNEIKKNGYLTVLGYNEPEGTLSGQSNVSVETAVRQLPYFIQSGLRVGSPAVEHLSSLLDKNSWFSQYMNQINPDNIDFIAVHEYLYNVCNCSDKDNTKKIAKEFLSNIQQVYNQYHKPIWITELGVVNHDSNWKHYSYNNEQGKNEIYHFMEYIINGVDDVKGLNDLDFVERYAWFPFDIHSEPAGASSLFITESDHQKNSSLKTGELNTLGRLYRDLGNPEGYKGSYLRIKNAEIHVSQDIKEIEYTGQPLRPSVTVLFDDEELIEGIDYTISYSNNINAGKNGILTIKGQGRFVGEKNQNFIIAKRDISHITYSQVASQKYTGQNIEPPIQLYDGKKLLKKDVDYQIIYENNKKIGNKTALMKIIGKGNYEGTKRVYFSIIENPIISVQLNKANATIYKGKTLTLKATIHPIQTSNSKVLSWTSSHPKIVTVSSTGVIKGISAGTAKITVKTSNGKTASCTVTVKNPSLSLNYTSKTLNKGTSLTLKASTTPATTIIYKTSHPSVATVTSKGVIKAVNGGKTTITVTANGLSKKCIITVPYAITYKLNGGKNNKNNPKSYYGKKIVFKNPTRKGYIFKGWYTSNQYKTKITSLSSGNKTLYAKWSKVSVNKAKTPTITNVKGKKLKISYKATTGAKGYQIQYSTSKKFSKPTSITKTTKSYTSKALKKNKTYYVRVRAYKLDSTGAKVYGKWSTVKSKKIIK